MTQAPLEIIVQARTRDLGGFTVQRILPFGKRRMVGPFVFFDQMGPQMLRPGEGIDVRPHPHIGLSTVTYLFEGELLHRDSLGSVQKIRPGEVNWMTAGRGIVHSERTSPELRPREKPLFGIQVWIAHPKKDEEIAPAFHHHGAEELPSFHDDGRTVRMILGALEGMRSPVRTLSPALYAEVQLDAGARYSIPNDYEERGVFVVAGELFNGGGAPPHGPGSLLAFGAGEIVLHAGKRGAWLMLIGGDRLDGERFIEWNFVSSSKERIEQAKADWVARRFPEVPGDAEFMPLPARAPTDVSYP